jgi:diketogulonate reductase-like aldo/keto reductase
VRFLYAVVLQWFMQKRVVVILKKVNRFFSNDLIKNRIILYVFLEIRQKDAKQMAYHQTCFTSHKVKSRQSHDFEFFGNLKKVKVMT